MSAETPSSELLGFSEALAESHREASVGEAIWREASAI